VCVVLAALVVMGGGFAFLGLLASSWGGGTALMYLVGVGGALMGGSAFVTLVGTGLSPGAASDGVRAGRVLRLLIPATGALSLTLLVALAAG
jgi:hypothetical protein